MTAYWLGLCSDHRTAGLEQVFGKVRRHARG